MDQQKMPYEMEDVAFSSRDQDCLLFLCQNQVEVCAPTTTELLALYNATEALKLWERNPQKVDILSDSLSVLQSLTSETPDDSQKRLMDNVNELAQSTKVVLQWIPAHTGIVGNEIADQLAKEGRKKDKPSSHLSYKEIRTLIRNRQKSTFIASIGGYTPQKDPLHQLSRHEQTTIFCLRTRHCGLKGHLKKIGIQPSALYVIVGKIIKHQITSCSHVHSTTERGNTSGLLVPQWTTSFGALKMIYT